MAVTTSPLLKDQQQTPGSVPTSPQKASADDNSFGNIVPFIVVMCIIAVISIASCVVGRVYARRILLSTPLQRGVNIRIAGNWVEWIKKKFRRRKAAAGAADGSGDQAGTSTDGNADQVAVPVAGAGGDNQPSPPGGPPHQV